MYFLYIVQERRKSRDDQKRDLALLENREDLWRTQLDDKNAEIVEMSKRINVRKYFNPFIQNGIFHLKIFYPVGMVHYLLQRVVVKIYIFSLYQSKAF